mgnify:CR=1 FL=1
MASMNLSTFKMNVFVFILPDLASLWKWGRHSTINVPLSIVYCMLYKYKQTNKIFFKFFS